MITELFIFVALATASLVVYLLHLFKRVKTLWLGIQRSEFLVTGVAS